ncbi:YibE/F family protein, partial [Patescibacteria group bacterium]|nr:YibE/F family protein [Patescibacteria group bacterium]
FMIKKIIIITFLCLLPIITFAQEEEKVIFEAKVIDATDTYLRIENNQGERFIIDKDIEVGALSKAAKGNNILVEDMTLADGTQRYMIVDFVRRAWVIALIALFVLIVWLTNGKKGMKSLINLVVTLVIALWIIIPLILKGWPPVWVTLLGGTIAMTWNMYFSYGRTSKARQALLGIIITLALTGILASIFVYLTSLTGFVDDETTFLVALGYTNINMQGLLLAAIIIGSLGVIDDLVINQVSVVEELRDASPNMKKKELFMRAIRIGQDHTGAMINTLILAYIGAAFPLTILIYLREGPFGTLMSTLNNEVIATEIVRTLIGSIGLLLAMPISTWIATISQTKQDNILDKS